MCDTALLLGFLFGILQSRLMQSMTVWNSVHFRTFDSNVQSTMREKGLGGRRGVLFLFFFLMRRRTPRKY